MQNTLKNRLIERLNDNLCDFRIYLDSLSRSKLIEMAGRITVVTEAYWYLTTQYEWDDLEEVRFLLLFQNPLSIMADAWEQRRNEDLVDFDLAMCEVFDEDGGIISEYPLVPDAAEDILIILE